MWIAVGVVVFGLLLAAAVAGLVHEAKRSAARAEHLASLATSLGLTAVTPEELVRGERPGEADVWDAAGVAFGLARDNRGIVSNLFHGRREGRDLWLFDFSYARIPGGSSLRATVVSVEVSALPLAPDLPAADGFVFAAAGTRLVCHGVPARDGRTPVAEVPALVDAALGAARRLEG